MLYDTHIHTCFSHDSKMPIENAIAAAKALNIGMIVTEHIDLNYPDPKAFRLNVPEYFASYHSLRTETVLLGVEIGLSLGDVEENRQIVEGNPFDYVIGSIHLVNDVDTYSEDYYTGKTKRQAYEEYFDAMLECVKRYEFIDSLGHIDYICRYARFEDAELYYDEFREQLDEVLALLAQKGKCLELNTRRIGSKQAAACLLEVYKRFRELGGRYATLGSDAHRAADIGKHFSLGLEILEYAGLQPVWFNQRQMHYKQG